MPHISYDLDGDGQVGGRDYVIAKHFDKDEDGRLNTTEKKAALQAIKDVRSVADISGHRTKLRVER